MPQQLPSLLVVLLSLASQARAGNCHHIAHPSLSGRVYEGNPNHLCFAVLCCAVLSTAVWFQHLHVVMAPTLCCVLVPCAGAAGLASALGGTVRQALAAQLCGFSICMIKWPFFMLCGLCCGCVQVLLGWPAA